MNGLRRALQLGLAALVASASGGLFLVPLFAAAAAITAALESGAAGMDPAAVGPMIAIAILLSALGIVQAVVFCWLPALVAGAILHAAGRRTGWARRRPAWAAAGATVSGIAWLRVFSPGVAGPPFDGSGPARPALLLAFLLAGAAAGLTYRSTLLALAPFLALDEDEDAG